MYEKADALNEGFWSKSIFKPTIFGPRFVLVVVLLLVLDAATGYRG
jgi:hypothetical protein